MAAAAAVISCQRLTPECSFVAGPAYEVVISDHLQKRRQCLQCCNVHVKAANDLRQQIRQALLLSESFCAF